MTPQSWTSFIFYFPCCSKNNVMFLLSVECRFQRYQGWPGLTKVMVLAHLNQWEGLRDSTRHEEPRFGGWEVRRVSRNAARNMVVTWVRVRVSASITRHSGLLICKMGLPEPLAISVINGEGLHTDPKRLLHRINSMRKPLGISTFVLFFVWFVFRVSYYRLRFRLSSSSSLDQWNGGQ